MNNFFKVLGCLTLMGCSSFDMGTTELPKPETAEDFTVEDFGIKPGGDFYDSSIIVSPNPLFSYPNTVFSPSIDITNDTAFNISNKSRFIVVNIPAQTLRAFDDGEEVLRTKVILGKPSTSTPTQRSNITSLKLNPDWHAPRGGNIERTYTQMIRNGEENKLREIGIDWYRAGRGYQFYQKPGPQNVLGRIKFEMFSPSNTYLHDTNRRDLFNMAERFISFGCIRVEEWDKLAAWMMGTTELELNQYLEKNTATEFINIDDVEIHIVYWTSEIRDGQSIIWPDYYGRN